MQVSLDSDSTNGPFFWYRVVSKFAPKGRNCHTASMVGDKMMVFGGFGGSKWFDELWVFDTHFIEWYRPEVRSAAQVISRLSCCSSLLCCCSSCLSCCTSRLSCCTSLLSCCTSLLFCCTSGLSCCTPLHVPIFT